MYNKQPIVSDLTNQNMNTAHKYNKQKAVSDLQTQ
jgi:hypothetical protein